MPRTKKNLWPFSDAKKHGVIPASGGLAHHTKRSAPAPKVVSGPTPIGTYKGYRIEKTQSGEYFSSLDRDSWYETKAQVQRAIDSYLKGRSNPMQMGYIDAAGAFHPIKRNESISEGFYDQRGIFHPIRHADDYDPEAVGESRTYAKAKRKRKKKANCQLGYRDQRGVFHPVRQNESISEGFYDSKGRFHPIRSADDYDPEAVGEDRAYAKRRRNPEDAADEFFEKFHGVPPTETVLIENELHYHEHVAGLGRLTEVWIETESGLLAHITFDPEQMPYLSSSEDGKQLFIDGGDEELDLKGLKMDGEEWVRDRMVIGRFAAPDGKRKHNITYQTRKEFDKFELIDYQHDLGEETGLRPMLEYEPRNQKLYISGGQYRIEIPVFGISPGIEN